MVTTLFLALLLIPLLEIAVFIRVGGLIGLWPTLALVLLTAVLGTLLLRRQGLATLLRARRTVQRGEPPVAELFDGACLLVAGVLLLTPGFVTDAIGALLLVPVFRRLLLARLARRMATETHRRNAAYRRPGGDGVIIEGEFVEVRRPPADPAGDGRDDRSDPPRGP